jgi:hypothetical protein
MIAFRGILILKELFKSHLELLCAKLQIQEKLKPEAEHESLAPASKVFDPKNGPSAYANVLDGLGRP